MRRISDISEKSAAAQMVLMLCNAPAERVERYTPETLAPVFGVRIHVAKEALNAERERRREYERRHG